MDTNTILKNARQAIVDRGWTIGTVVDASGRVCLVGALRVGVGCDPLAFPIGEACSWSLVRVMSVLESELIFRRNDRNIAAFNDSCNNVQQVLDFLDLFIEKDPSND